MTNCTYYQEPDPDLFIPDSVTPTRNIRGKIRSKLSLIRIFQVDFHLIRQATDALKFHNIRIKITVGAYQARVLNNNVIGKLFTFIEF